MSRDDREDRRGREDDRREDGRREDGAGEPLPPSHPTPAPVAPEEVEPATGGDMAAATPPGASQTPQAASEAPLPRGSGRDYLPWGPWASLVLTGGLLVLYFLLQGLVVVGLAAFWSAKSGEPAGSLFNRHTGYLLALSILVSAPVVTGLTALLVSTRGRVRAYLGLRLAGWRPTLGWLAVFAAFLVAWDLVGSALGRPPVPDFMIDAYTTAGPRPLLWVALGFFVPVVEEVLYRGFLVPGLAASRLGFTGAVVVSAAAFAVVHFQYDLYDMTGVFLLGALFAVQRLKTGSLYLSILLHAAVNVTATVQVAWLVGSGG